jgi:DNA-binding beta-propeller fold protein YncE
MEHSSLVRSMGATSKFLHAGALPLALAFVVACTSDEATEPVDDTTEHSDSDPATTPPPGVPPTATVLFPPPGTTTPSTRLWVRGTTSPGDDLPAGVWIGDVEATSEDGFQTWTARITLTSGLQTLSIAPRDTEGREGTPVELTVTRTHGLGEPRDLALHPDGETAWVLDRRLQAVLKVDLSTGTTEELSGRTTGWGPTLLSPTSLVFDGANLWVADEDLAALLRIDPTDGTRRIVSDATHGVGPTLGALRDVVFADGRLLVSDTTLDAVLQVDPLTGDRVALASTDVGVGPALLDPQQMSWHAPSGRLLLTDERADALFAVDLLTGDRAVVADALTGAGPPLSGPRGVLAGGPDEAWVLDHSGRRLVRVDLSTGDRTEVTGAGPSLIQPRALVASAEGTLWLVDAGLDALISVSPATGDRTLVSDARVGTWQTLSNPTAAAPAPDGWWVADSQDDVVVHVDAATGHQRVVADGALGAGPLPTDPRELLALPTGPLLVADADHNAVLALDPTTGDRTIWSAEDDGPTLHDPRGLLLDEVHARVIALQGGEDWSLQSIAWTGGTRTLLADPSGTGPEVLDPRSVALSADGTIAWLADRATDALIAVSLATGDRSLLASSEQPPGLVLDHVPALLRHGASLLAFDDLLEGAAWVSLADGRRRLLSDVGLGGGPLLLSPEDAVWDEGRGLFLVVERFGGRLLWLDPVTGGRVALPR